MYQPQSMKILQAKHSYVSPIPHFPQRISTGLARKGVSPLSFSKHKFIGVKVHSFLSLWFLSFWESFVFDQCLCSLFREERSFLLVGVRQWPTSDTYHLQKPQPGVEQSFYLVSALASGLQRSSFNLQRNYVSEAGWGSCVQLFVHFYVQRGNLLFFFFFLFWKPFILSFFSVMLIVGEIFCNCKRML